MLGRPFPQIFISQKNSPTYFYVFWTFSFYFSCILTNTAYKKGPKYHSSLKNVFWFSPTLLWTNHKTKQTINIINLLIEQAFYSKLIQNIDEKVKNIIEDKMVNSRQVVF